MIILRRICLALALCAALPLALSSLPPARATVNSAVNKSIVLGNGSQTQFTFNFVGVATAYISVIYTDASGNETVLTQGSGSSQYQIALNPPVQGAIWGLGGTVTYNPGTPIASGTTLTIFRTLPLTQAISLQNLISVATLGKGSETGLDTGVMQGQQIAENIARAIVAPVVDPAAPLPLPPVAQRANKGMAFDSLGNPIAAALPASGAISSAMQPVVGAATLALGRTAFGLGSIATEGIGSGLQDDGAGNARVITQGLTSVSTNQNVTSGFASQAYVVTGPVNFNLPRANTLWNGFSFTAFIVTSPMTLIPDTNDSIQGQASGTNVAIPANSVAVISTDGAAGGNWRVKWSPWNVDGATKSFIAPVFFPAVRALTITNNAGTPNTQIDIAGVAVMISAANYGVKQASSFTIDLTQGTVTSTANGMDGEAVPANGWLYLYAISNGASAAGLATTANPVTTAPTLPAGYTFSKYIGAMRTASSILMRTVQQGRRTQYQVTAATNTAALPTIASGASGSPTIPTWTAFSVSTVVPAPASEIMLVVNNSTASNRTVVAPNNAYGGSTSTTNPPPLSSTAQQPMPVSGSLVLESSNIYYAAEAGGRLQCLGWIDNLI